MALTPSTRNILKVYRSTTDEHRANGFAWYFEAREIAVELARTLVGDLYVEDDVIRAAGVLAVLSPRVRWDKNVEVARLAYAQWAAVRTTDMLVAMAPLPVLGANSAKAFRILAGEDPEDVVGGPKVRAFWRTIVDPTDPRAVVIDRHALDVAVGRVLDDKSRGIILGRKGAYDHICDRYHRAAKIASREAGRLVTPAEVQAICWVAWRESK